jgi:hypothetical protein
MVAKSWYKLVRGGGLEQGDILRDCPIFFFDKVPLSEDVSVGEEPEVEWQANDYDVIVLTQSCDLQIGQGAQKVQQVVLCPLQTLTEVRKDPDHTIKNNGLLKEAAAMKLPAFFVLDGFNSSKHPALNREVSVVRFQQVYTLPIEVARRVAQRRGWRLRLKSPYKEALSSRFGTFFARLGLDLPIPPDSLKLPTLPQPAPAGS